MNSCIECEAETSNPRFCSLSCSGKYQRGRRSNLINRERTCLRCGLVFTYKSTPRQKFCSKSCSASHTNSVSPKVRRQNYNCLYCATALKPSAKKYCNNTCKASYEKEKVLLNWKQNPTLFRGYLPLAVRNHLISRADNSCSRCGWAEIHPTTNKVPLEIDHINGDGYDNSPENLRVLCPNCHSLTLTYRALNKKSSRTHR